MSAKKQKAARKAAGIKNEKPNNQSVISKKFGVYEITQLGILSALIIIFSYTPLGYPKISKLVLTFFPAIVSIGAINCGIIGGTVLGAVFGITAFQLAFSDALGAIMLGYNAFYTFIVCVIARILMGFLVAVIYKSLKKIFGQKIWVYSVTGLSGAVLNTVFFLGTLNILFGRYTEIQELFKGLSTIITLNAIPEAVFSTLAVGSIAKALYTARVKISKEYRAIAAEKT